MKQEFSLDESQKKQSRESPGQTSSNPSDSSPEQLLTHLLMVQCQMFQAEGGVILRAGKENQVDVLALYPPAIRTSPKPSTWITQSAESVHEALLSDQVVVVPWNRPDPMPAHSLSYNIFLTRLSMSDLGQDVAAFLIGTLAKESVETKSQMLQWSTRLLNLQEKRLLQQESPAELKRLQQATETLSAANSQDGFKRAAMAFCNEMASQWQCERVSLGFLEKRYVKLKAMSHTEDFSRKMEIVQYIESAMEECLDQDAEVLSPAPEGGTTISRAADELSKHIGPLAVLSFPLRRKDEVFAVVTLERQADRKFSPGEIETLRLACELCTARLADLYEHGRWFGATVAFKGRNLVAKIVGPKHTWLKVITVLCVGALLFLLFGKGQFRPEAPVALEATHQQVIPAPFDGYIKDVKVEINDPVEANSTVLAILDTSEIRLQLAAAEAEQAGYLKQASAAMRDGETAQAQIAQANADKLTAQIDLLNYQLSRAEIVSPISGIVITGDLKRQIGGPVKTGDVLFEVAPPSASLRAEILVPEDQIYYIRVGQEGQLATASFPEKRINFVVERINPVAEVVNQRNVFKVRVNLSETHSWMRPGMEGVAKVSVGKRRYVWIWTYKIVNWVRMKLWI